MIWNVENNAIFHRDEYNKLAFDWIESIEMCRQAYDDSFLNVYDLKFTFFFCFEDVLWLWSYSNGNFIDSNRVRRCPGTGGHRNMKTIFEKHLNLLHCYSLRYLAHFSLCISYLVDACIKLSHFDLHECLSISGFVARIERKSIPAH